MNRLIFLVLFLFPGLLMALGNKHWLIILAGMGNELQSVVASGTSDFGVGGIRIGISTEGSALIIQAVTNKDPLGNHQMCQDIRETREYDSSVCKDDKNKFVLN